MKFFYVLFALFVFTACGSSKPKVTNHTNNKSLTLKNKVIESARAQLGYPHKDKYPNKKNATDCSGMTRQSYLSIGVELSPRSSDQAHLGVKVDKKDLQLADLVFFSSKKGRSGISHVGLISKIEGDKVYFIHTSTSRGVVEDDFYMEHWQNVFVTARRIINN